MSFMKKIILLLVILFLNISFVYQSTAAEEMEDAPVLNSVQVTRDTGLRLEWSPSEAAANNSNVKYMILRSTDGGASYQGLVQREIKYGTYFVDATGLEPGKEYFYKVREFIDGTQMNDSNVVSAIAVATPSAQNEFSDKENAAEYLKEQMILREPEIEIIYNAPEFPSNLGPEMYDMAREDTDSSDPETADEGDYLRYSIIPGTIDIATGIDGKVGENTSYVFTYQVEYYTSYEDEQAVDQKVNEILQLFQQQGITKESSEYDRAKAVYDYLSTTVHYNNGTRPDNGNIMITAYDSLVRQEAQCYGQVLGAYRLLKELGIPVRRVNGQANVTLGDSHGWLNHGWNIVKIGDVWYNYDATASASYFEGFGEKQLMTYKYLLVSDVDLNGNYQRSNEYAVGSEFSNNHPMALDSFGFEPEAPEELNLKLNDKGNVVAEYTGVDNAEGYILSRSESESGPFIQVGESNKTECVDQTAEKNKEYHYKIQAYRTVEGYKYCSAYSPRRIIYTKEVTAPSNLKVTELTLNSVTITWSGVPNTQYYQIWRAEKGGEYENIATLDSETLTYTNKGLTYKGNYSYKIRGYRFANGDRVFGDYSEELSVNLPKLNAPEGVKATENTYNTLKISWEPVAEASFYQVFRSDAENGKYVKLGTYDSKTFSSISRSLGCGTTYYYKVRAYCWLNGERAFSDFSSVASAAPKLDAPGNVKANSYNYNTIKIDWDKTDGADYYQVYRGTSQNGKYVLLGTYEEDQTSSFSRSLGCGTTYYYKVRAYRWVNGERIFSEYSLPVSAAPTLMAPEGVSAKGATYNTVDIKWEKREGASFYQVYRSDKKDGKYVLLGTYDEDTTSSVSRQLGCGTTYYYKVRAYRWVSGERVFSDFSKIVSAKPVLSAPSNVKAVGKSATTIGISWNKVTGGEYYQVYRSDKKDGKYVLLGTYDSNTSSSISKQLKNKTTYYYKVRAYRWVNGERVFSSFSSIASAKTL